MYLILGTNNCLDGSDERQDCPPCLSGQVIFRHTINKSIEMNKYI